MEGGTEERKKEGSGVERKASKARKSGLPAVLD